MRLLYFTRDYTSHDFRFLAALAESGYEVHYLRLERREPQLEDRPLPAGVRVVPWSGGKRLVRLRDGPRLWFELRGILSRLKPDLVHAGPLQRAAFLTALSGFRPLVSMSWGYDLLQDAQRNAAWRWATRYTLRHSDVLVGDSEVVRRKAIAFGMPPERIVTFPWGVDLHHFSPQGRWDTFVDSTQDDAPFVLLSTRSWEAIYGVEVIAQAFVRAVRQCPQLRLVMLGHGSLAGRLRQILSPVETRLESDLLSSGERYASALDQWPSVIMPGQVSYERLPRYYRMAHLYLSASYSDGSSISLLEAMACGCPVLVSDIDGNREWVIPEVNGWLFPPGDVEALSRAILRAVERRAHLPEMGAAGRRMVEERANWERNFPKLLEAYRMALAWH